MQSRINVTQTDPKNKFVPSSMDDCIYKRNEEGIFTLKIKGRDRGKSTHP